MKFPLLLSVLAIVRVSIPYRLNEIKSNSNFSSLRLSFQFLIGSMKSISLTIFNISEIGFNSL